MVLAALAALATSANAQDRDADWIRRPSADDIAAVWPAKALKQGYGGKAVISCVVTVQGTLRDCRVAEED
ncbi:MAG TPA: hypothetical protein VFE03_08910, partial [Caulobacteraceae bacterium]|nr:hypothetical protein [Caulobacteraceae bacterium]